MEQQLTTTSILALFDTNKAQRQSFIESLMNELESGTTDPLKVHYELKCIENIVDGLTNTDPLKNKSHLHAIRYRELVLDAAQKYGQKKFDFSNSVVEIKEAGTKYDWSKCGDEKLLIAMEKLKEFSEWIKARHELLKNIPDKGMVIVDEETGETTTLYPPAKSSTTIAQITLK